MATNGLLTLLKLPEASQITDLDDPDNIYTIRDIIKRKPFLQRIYESFYRDLLGKCATIPSNAPIVELGSGAGFIKRFNPHIITSDVLPYDGIDRVFSALDVPFQDGTIGAFVMIDVLHHIQDSAQFFAEMERCLPVGGKVVMIEPANTPWSKFIYTRFHHEPFEPRGGWGFTAGGPLSGANMAIPWIVFCRDADRFTREFPHLKVCSIRIHTPFRYLVSGGLSLKQLLPSPLYPVVHFIEWLLSPFNQYLGMFMTIELQKI